MGRGNGSGSSPLEEIERTAFDLDDLVAAQLRSETKGRQRLWRAMADYAMVKPSRLSGAAEASPAGFIDAVFAARKVMAEDFEFARTPLLWLAIDGFGDPQEGHIHNFLAVQQCRMLGDQEVRVLPAQQESDAIIAARDASFAALSDGPENETADEFHQRLSNVIEDAITLQRALDCAEILLDLPLDIRIDRVADGTVSYEELDDIKASGAMNVWPDKAELAAALAAQAIRRDRCELRSWDRPELRAHLVAQFWPQLVRDSIKRSGLNDNIVAHTIWALHYPQLCR